MNVRFFLLRIRRTPRSTRTDTPVPHTSLLRSSNDATTLEQSLASGEVVAAVGWNSSYTALRRQGIPVKYMTPKEGLITWICGVVLMTDSAHVDRSEEHTSELQSLMRISYAVFSLIKKHE